MSAAVHDVPGCFKRIPGKVRQSTFWGSTKKYLGACNCQPQLSIGYEYTSGQNLGKLALMFDARIGHFQGVQRVGSRLLLSAGDSKRGSELIVIEMGSRPEGGARGPWSLPRYAGQDPTTNTYHSHKRPWPKDAAVRVVPLDQCLWHAGGIQAAEGIVAVPIYGAHDCSEIRFVDLSGGPDPPTLKKGGVKTKAVGFARFQDLYVLAVWDDHRLEFHTTRDLVTGFASDPDIILGTKQGEQAPAFALPARFHPAGEATYQSLNLVWDTQHDKLYLLGSRNTSQLSPFITGEDRLDLYEVTWPITNGSSIRLVASKQMYCYDQQCNFGAAVGIYTEGEDKLWVYAAAHYLHDGASRFNFNEYAYTT